MSSELAMSTKARAMFGSRLQANEYETLIQKKSVPEVASYLKNETYFSKTLDGINEKAIHREQLESLLRMDIFHRLEKLERYGGENDRGFIYAFVMRSEIRMILACVRYIVTNDEEIRSGIISDLPMFAQKYFSFDIKRLPEVTSFSELLDVLKGTAYERIIFKYQSERLEEIDYIALEHDLELELYKDTIQLLDLTKKNEVNVALDQLIMSKAELINLSAIYRLKKYFKESSLTIEKFMLPYTCFLKKHELEDMIENCDADEVLERVAKKYHRYTHDLRFTSIEQYVQMIQFNMGHHMIEYYQDSHVVFLSYLLLAETEIQNLINIIEGIRYQIAPDRIRALLVY